MRLRSIMSRIPAVPAPLGLLILLFLAFGLMIPWLGFYWDDWPVILTGRLLGVEGYTAFYQYDRPVSAWTYILTFPLLGSSPVRWHLFTLLLRWLTSLAMWWTLVLLWPNRKRELTWAAFLFAVYPVFIQQPISVAYSQHWTCYLLFFLSLGLMVKAHRGAGGLKYWLLAALAVACSLLHLLTMEYYAGLELVRPLVLWILLGEQELSMRRRIVAVVRGWLPYLLGLIAFVVWRFFFLQFPGEDSNPPVLLQSMLTDPVGGGLRLVQIAAQDVAYLLVNVWANILSNTSIVLNDRFVLLSWAVGFAAAAAVFLFFRPRSGLDPAGRGRWVRQALLLGASAVILGMLPVWVTDRQIIVGMYSNRFGLAAMFGASLLFAAFIEGWISRPAQRTVIYCILIALAVSMHLRVANDYRWSWELQKRFAWQLSWRAPAIAPGTAIFSDGEVFTYVGLYSTAAIVNLTYPPTGQGENLPYWFYSLGREFLHSLPEMQAGIPLKTEFRNYTFTGHTREGITIHYNPRWSTCLQVLPREEASNPNMPEITRDTLTITDLSRILPEDTSSAYPPSDIFGPEPEHGWCYFNQKMGLAAQAGDWEQVAAVAEQAREQGNTPESDGIDVPSEWFPLIQAYGYTGRWQEAQQVSLEILNRDPPINKHMCQIWNGLVEGTTQTAERDAAARDIRGAAECP